MALPLFRKKTYLVYLLCFVVVSVFVYQRNVPIVGLPGNDKGYFDGNAQGSATTSLDIPVSIIQAEQIPTKVQATEKPASPEPSYRLPLSNSCESDTILCGKISFVGSFSDTDKRKYQSMIIRLVKNLDGMLLTPVSIKDTLYSITLDSSKGTRRGRAGSSTIVIYLGNITSQQELTEIITHELGHIVDLGVLQGNRHTIQNTFQSIDRHFFSADDLSLDFYRISRLDNNTRRGDASAMGFVGGYAMSDPFEDFAESFNMYLNHHNVFALLATSNTALKKKFVFMETLFHKKYLQADIATTVQMKDNLDVRARDTTRGY